MTASRSQWAALRAGFAAALARRAKRAGAWAVAARRYRKALAVDPERSTLWVQYGNALKETGALIKAECAYRRALDIDRRNADAHLQLGHALKLQRRGSDAVAAYQCAVDCDPLLYHALLELQALGASEKINRCWLPEGAPAVTGETSALCHRPLVVFDATDVLNHLPHHRLATGIQRVQLGIITSLLHDPDPEIETVVAWFNHNDGRWIVIPPDFFLQFITLALSPKALEEPVWREAVRALVALFVHGEPVSFRNGAALINLGASWTLGNYFLELRRLKAQYNIHYLPFVHDCIPAFFPEFCDRQTVQEYLGWSSGMFDHADGVFANSVSTADDLQRLAAAIEHSVVPARVIRLDAGFLGGNPDLEDAVLRRYRLERQGFVLMVSSFEPRKNHVAAFRAWIDLVHRHGRRNTPLLVCVGARQWLADGAIDLLRSRRALTRSVRVLSAIGDAELFALYRSCLFTFYPSQYEGWGLPVTESLSLGKVPLVSAVPALQEAGGDLAEYFDLTSATDLVSKLERLIYDKAHRTRREAAIAKGFRARSWRDIASDIIDHSSRLPEWTTRQAGMPRRLVALGCYYGLGQNTQTQLAPGIGWGETCRAGNGWWSPEPWGCWLKSGTAELVCQLPTAITGGVSVRLLLRGNPAQRAQATICLATSTINLAAELKPDELRWIALRFDPAALVDPILSIQITASESYDMALLTDRMDCRVVTIGVCGFLFEMDSPIPGTGSNEQAIAAGAPL